MTNEQMRQLAVQYADEREVEREPDGFADVYLWNRDFEDRLRELENLNH